MKHSSDRSTGHSYYGGLTSSQPPGSGQQQYQSSSRTADGLVPAEKNPQAGTSQPVRHASLTLSPRIKVGKEKKEGRGMKSRGGKKGWEVCGVGGWTDRQQDRAGEKRGGNAKRAK